MKILYLVPHVPNPTKARSYYNILGLMSAGNQVTVATFIRTRQDMDYANQLRQLGSKVIDRPLTNQRLALNGLSAIFSRRPLQAVLMWSAALMQDIVEHLYADPPDIIHVEHLRMTPYGLRLRYEWPVVWDAVDYLTTLFQQAATQSSSPIWRLFARVEASRLADYERNLTSQFLRTLVITKHDQQLLQRNNPFADRICVVSAGLIPPAQSTKPREPATLIITGNMDYHPNVASVLHFVAEILPLIRSKYPLVKLRIVGANPVQAIRALSSETIQVTGFVPLIMAELQQATVALAPIIYSAGLQNKVLEAFFAEIPVVATPAALTGYDVRNGEHLLVANLYAEFAEATMRLLGDAELRRTLSKAGRRYAEQNHDLRVTTKNLVETFHTVLDTYAASAQQISANDVE